METLKDRVTIVTGGARGLGEAICKNLFDAGAIVIPVDIRQDLLEEMSAKNSHGERKMKPIVMDLCDEVQVDNVIHRVVEEYGRLDVLINNAGTDKTLSIEELPISDWDEIIAVNLRGPFLTSKAAFPIMKQQGGGSIVNIVSTASKRTWPNAAAYHASKWGLLGFTHALHTEARPVNIRVTALIAGGMRTPFLLDRFPDIDINNLQEPANVAETVRFVLMQPQGTVIPEVMVLPMRETSWP